jgi:Flp pilus assembly pilin Flp
MRIAILNFLRACRSSKKGQTLVEYALVLCVLTVVAVASFQFFGSRLITVFSAIDILLDTAQTST